MKKNIVILGAGFAGVECARYLESRVPDDWQIILFSRDNHFVFTPMLAEVVGASITPLHVVWPIRQMMRRAWCRTAQVSQIDLARQEVSYQTASGLPATQHYEHLILACGSFVNLDILPGMSAHGWPMKTIGDALYLRNHLIGQMEKAEVEPNPEIRKRLMTIVVVGGGFSGVEVAGELMDLLTDSCRYYSTITRSDIRVVLLQSRDRLLPELPPELGEFAFRKMTMRGLDIRLKTRAQAVSEHGVRLQNGDEIMAGTIICTIGNTINPLIEELKLPLEKGRLETEPDMRVKGRDNIWAVGDCAAIVNTRDQQPSPPTAQFAVRQAKQLAKNLLRVIANEPTKPFYYKAKGMFASIGHRKAVGSVLGMNISGFMAWFLWRGFYLTQMPSLARKIQIAFDWAWELIFPRDIVQLSMAQTERLSRAHYEPGDDIFRKNDPADKFYIIERGRAGVYVDDHEGPVAMLTTGDHFGERALLRGSRHTATVRAEESLDVITIGQGSFGDLVRNLGVMRKGMMGAVERIESANMFMEVAREHAKLQNLRASDVMSGPLETIPLGLCFQEALDRCQKGGRGAYPVMNETGQMVGFCSRSDFYKAVRQMKNAKTPLKEIMQQPVITVKESAQLPQVVMLFLQHPIKRLVVVKDEDETCPIGIVTPFDILPMLSDDGRAEGEGEDEKAV